MLSPAVGLKFLKPSKRKAYCRRSLRNSGVRQNRTATGPFALLASWEARSSAQLSRQRMSLLIQ